MIKVWARALEVRVQGLEWSFRNFGSQKKKHTLEVWALGALGLRLHTCNDTTGGGVFREVLHESILPWSPWAMRSDMVRDGQRPSVVTTGSHERFRAGLLSSVHALVSWVSAVYSRMNAVVKLPTLTEGNFLFESCDCGVKSSGTKGGLALETFQCTCPCLWTWPF